MAKGGYCDHCEREMFGKGPWHDEDCDNYREEPTTLSGAYDCVTIEEW